jgi:hypothetical protein
VACRLDRASDVRLESMVRREYEWAEIEEEFERGSCAKAV